MTSREGCTTLKRFEKYGLLNFKKGRENPEDYLHHGSPPTVTTQNTKHVIYDLIMGSQQIA